MAHFPQPVRRSKRRRRLDNLIEECKIAAVRPAPLWLRYLAGALDYIFITCIWVATCRILGRQTPFGAGDLVAFFIIDFFYFLTFDGLGGRQSLGKMILGLGVVDIHGKSIPFKRALFRAAVKLVMVFCTIGLMLFDTHNTMNIGYHDEAGSTVVVRCRARNGRGRRDAQ